MARTKQHRLTLASISGTALALARNAVHGALRIARRLREDPDARERASAMAAFAFIFAFGAASLDFLITGGPDWNPGASAAPIALRIADPASLAPVVYEAPPALPEFELTLYEPVGPVEDLLGGPEPLVTAFMTTEANDSAAISLVAETASRAARKLKAPNA